jgi:hypothetical protein
LLCSLHTWWPGAAAPGGTVAPGSLGKLQYQLSWEKDVEFAGPFIGVTEGIYAANGFGDDEMGNRRSARCAGFCPIPRVMSRKFRFAVSVSSHRKTTP